MKSIYSKIAAVALAMPIMLSGCIEQTYPTSSVTAEQIAQSSKGLEGIVKGMPAYMKKYHTWNTSSYNFGYPSIFCMLNMQTQDCIQNPTGYEWFAYWSELSLGLNSGYMICQINWYYLNFCARAANDVISNISNPANDAQVAALAQAYIYRSSIYLDMARIYEFLPNETISGVNEAGNDVTNLTVPVCTPDMTGEELNNNPRLTHDQMVEFLLKDLEYAVELYGKTDEVPSEKVLPSVYVAYGLMARVYMWDGQYAKAAEYAKKAYTESGATPLTQAQFLSTTQGFNDSSFSSWMWAIQYESNDDPVQNGYDCWMSFQSCESTTGYGGHYGAYFMMDRSLYDQISNADWRKLTFKAPEGHPLSGRETILNKSKYDSLEDYASFKFHPCQGNYTDPTVGFACAVPLMRVEEMYFIEAEARAHLNATDGQKAIEDFMQKYRYSTYKYDASTGRDIIDEIFLQKRIEFFGEGITFFDFKRLDKGVTRAYAGTNWPEEQRFNTIGRPGWLNWPFVDYEGEFNMGVRGYLNPNVGGGIFTPVVMDEE